MINLIKLFAFVMLLTPLLSIVNPPVAKTKISATELELYDQIMAYRKSKGLAQIPLSNSLTIVAQMHSKDLMINKPDSKKDCNIHSWSNKGKWSSCCYTENHKQANCMWGKPNELTSYTGNGYEIAAFSSEVDNKDYVITPLNALNMWKKSIHHNHVIINKAIWKDVEWNAIGIGIYEGYATVWFGQEKDLDGEPIKE